MDVTGTALLHVSGTGDGKGQTPLPVPGRKIPLRHSILEWQDKVDWQNKNNCIGEYEMMKC